MMASESDRQAPDLDVLALDRESGQSRLLGGLTGRLATALCMLLSLYALYWTQFSINTTVYRASFLGFILTLAFLYYPWRSKAQRVSLFDWLFIALSLVALYYLATHLNETKTRATRPLDLELWLGGGLILLVLEATRRSTGWVLPGIAVFFLAYAFWGRHMPEPFNHRGFSLERLIGQNYLTLEGLFSTPLDVAATFIVLFTIYGAVLDKGGAGKFFIDWAFALFGKKPSPAAPGRAVVASGFLLGTVSGSGIATTVTLSSLAWPMLKRSGYKPAVAGGMLAASGVGAVVSPPTLGAAAFIIAEYLEIDYVDVLLMAMVPTLLYYLSCWLMVEADARRLGVTAVKTSDLSLRALTFSQGYHFLSLAAIAVLLALGMTAFMAVFWSIVVAFVLSLLRRDTQLVSLVGAAAGLLLTLVLWLLVGERVSVAAFGGLLLAGGVTAFTSIVQRRRQRDGHPASERLLAALIDGGKACIGIAATCATAGIIVSVINLTGLGLKLSGLIVDLGGGELFFTTLLAALAMLLLGTAVPVTASYIIAAVVLVPALTSVGVREEAAHMFMFYYAVLSDVSPPTALAPFAASAICGGRPFPTMFQAWKYALPAFLVPFVFCLSPEGSGLLLFGTAGDILAVTLSASLALVGFALAFAGWARGPANGLERLCAFAGGCLLLTSTLWADVTGALLIAAAIALNWLRQRKALVA